MADTVPAPQYFIDPSGDTVEVQPQDIAAAVKSGYLPASPKQIADFQHLDDFQRKANLPTSESVKAGAAGFGRGLTFGASDWLLTHATTGDNKPLSTPERLEQLKEQSPGASLVGEGIGIAAPLVLSGGAAAPGVAAKGALRAAAEVAPTALVSRAGQATTRLVERALPSAQGAVGQIVRKAIAHGAGSAVEGAAYGLGQVVSERALGDPNMTAESALSEVGLSAALMGGLGFMGGAASELLPKAFTKAKAALGSAATGAGDNAESALLGFWEKHGVERNVGDLLMARRNEVAELQKVFPRVADALPYQSEESVKRILKEWPNAMRDSKSWAAVQESVNKGVEDMISNVEGAYRQALKDIIPEERARLLNDQLGKAYYGWKWGQDEATRVVKRMNSAIEALRADRDLYEQGYASALEKVRDGFAKRITEESNPAEIVDELLNARKLLDDQIPYAKNRMALPFAERNALDIVQNVRTDLKESLRNEEVWGKAGARNAALNEAQAEYIEARKALLGERTKAFDAKETKLVHQVGGMNGEIKVIPQRANTWLNQVDNPRGQAISDALEAYRNASQKLLSEIETSYKTAPVGKFDKQALESLVNKTGTTIAEARQQAATNKLIGSLEKPQLGSLGHVAPPGHAGGDGAGLLGGLSALGAAPLVEHLIPGAGPVAAAFGAAKAGYHAFESLKNVPQTVAALAKLERMAQSASKAIESGAAALLRGGKAALPVVSAETAALAARAVSAERRDPVKLYEKRVAEIQHAPEALIERLQGMSEGLHEHAPETAQALQVTSARAMMFLSSKVPQHPPAGPLASQWKPNATEIATFNRYYDAVQRPTSILTQASHGTLSPEAVEAVKTVYPQLYAKITSAVYEQIAERGPEAVPYKSRLMLGLLLGQSLDGLDAPGMMQRNAATYAGPSAKGPDSQPAMPPPIRPTAKGAGAITLSSRMLTPSQASSHRR